MAELTVAGTYAKALFEVAKDVDKIDLIDEELNQLQEIFLKEEDFKKLFESPALAPSDKKQIIETVFEGKMSEELVNFLYILIDKGRTNQIERIIRKYGDEIAEYRNFSNGTIVSAKPLKEEQIAEFEKQVSKLLNKKVKLNNTLDKKLIAGVKILVEGKVIDASVKLKLDTMLRELQK